MPVVKGSTLSFTDLQSYAKMGETAYKSGAAYDPQAIENPSVQSKDFFDRRAFKILAYSTVGLAVLGTLGMLVNQAYADVVTHVPSNPSTPDSHSDNSQIPRTAVLDNVSATPTPAPMTTQGACATIAAEFDYYQGDGLELPPVVGNSQNNRVHSLAEAAPNGNGPLQCKLVSFEDDAVLFYDPALQIPFGRLEKGTRVTATGWADGNPKQKIPYRWEVIVRDPETEEIVKGYVTDRAFVHPLLGIEVTDQEEP